MCSVEVLVNKIEGGTTVNVDLVCDAAQQHTPPPPRVYGFCSPPPKLELTEEYRPQCVRYLEGSTLTPSG